MNRADVMRLARQAGVHALQGDEQLAPFIERFAALVLAQAMEPAGSDSGHSTARSGEPFTAPTLEDAYAEGRRDEQEELASVLPGVTYMDPPDGGAPTILEQLQRQAKDAARYLWLRNQGLKYANVGLGTTCEGVNVVDFSPTFTIPEPVGMRYEDNEWSLDDLDAAIDAAMKGKP